MKHGDDMSFFDKVYQVVKLIPYGRVTTYGAIANYLGQRGSARMVGWAMNNSHGLPEHIPAHRVVNRKGHLTGKNHFGGPLVMQQLLESENITIIQDQIQHFDKLFWDPSVNLHP